MTDLSTRTIDRSPVAAVSRPRSIKPATVSAPALALHLDCSRTYIVKLEVEGVFNRVSDGSGFDLDGSRVAYLRFLRCEKRLSPRSEADADFQRAKAELIRMRIAEKQRTLIPLAGSIETIDRIVGIMLTDLGQRIACGVLRGVPADNRRGAQAADQLIDAPISLDQSLPASSSKPAHASGSAGIN
jgi:hypothetical protein